MGTFENYSTQHGHLYVLMLRNGEEAARVVGTEKMKWDLAGDRSKDSLLMLFLMFLPF